MSSALTSPRLGAIALACLAGLAAAPASATLITGVTATSGSGTFSSYDIANLTNGAGLSSIAPNAVHDISFTKQWMNGGDRAGELVFDLGGARDLAGIYLWPYTFEGFEERSISTFSLDLSADGSIYTTVLDTVTLPEFETTATFFDLSGSGILAGFARLRYTDNHGANFYSGLAEAQFDAVADVPLPAALPLFAGALALGGLVLRRPRA